MKNLFTTKSICRAAVIAALYAVLTWAFGNVSYMPLGIIEIRPSEALTILPLFFIEAVPGLYVGCVLANLLSAFGIFDITLGGAATLIAALGTYFVGKAIKNDWVRVFVGGLFPILVNALLIPLVIYLGWQGDIAEWSYGAFFIELFVSEAIWVYALGIPFYFTIKSLQNKGIRVLMSE